MKSPVIALLLAFALVFPVQAQPVLQKTDDERAFDKFAEIADTLPCVHSFVRAYNQPRVQWAADDSVVMVSAVMLNNKGQKVAGYVLNSKFFNSLKTGESSPRAELATLRALATMENYLVGKAPLLDYPSERKPVAVYARLIWDVEFHALREIWLCAEKQRFSPIPAQLPELNTALAGLKPGPERERAFLAGVRDYLQTQVLKNPATDQRLVRSFGRVFKEEEAKLAAKAGK